MSRKSVPFSMSARPASKQAAPDVLIDAHSDEWVSDRHVRGEAPSAGTTPGMSIDLAAERGLMEVFALSLLAPLALGWFWMMHATSGRVRL